MNLKALSLRQPYANLIAQGNKTIETRTWGTAYRGDILVCASMSGAGEPKGVALCIVRLVDIRPMTPHDAEAACIEFYAGAKAWLLDELRLLEDPIPIKGRLYLFDASIPDDTILIGRS